MLLFYHTMKNFQKLNLLGPGTIFRTPTTIEKELSSNKKDKLPNIEKDRIYSFSLNEKTAKAIWEKMKEI